jgi:hypothetical protein
MDRAGWDYDVQNFLPDAGTPCRRSLWRWRVGATVRGPRQTPPDSGKWTCNLGAGGWGNRELENYTRDAPFDEGRLVIEAKDGTGGCYVGAPQIAGSPRLRTARSSAPRCPRTGHLACLLDVGEDIKTNDWPNMRQVAPSWSTSAGTGDTTRHHHGPGCPARAKGDAHTRVHVYAVRGNVKASVHGRTSPLAEDYACRSPGKVGLRCPFSCC